MSSGQIRIKFFAVSRASNILYRSSRPPVRRRFIAGGATLCALVRTATPPEFVDTVYQNNSIVRLLIAADFVLSYH